MSGFECPEGNWNLPSASDCASGVTIVFFRSEFVFCVRVGRYIFFVYIFRLWCRLMLTLEPC